MEQACFVSPLECTGCRGSDFVAAAVVATAGQVFTNKTKIDAIFENISPQQIPEKPWFYGITTKQKHEHNTRGLELTWEVEQALL